MTFDNGKTTKNYHVYLQDRPSIPIAEENVEYVPIPGRDEYLTRKDGYLNRSLKVTFNYSDTSNLIGYIRAFIGQLKTCKSFYFSDDPTVEYRVKTVSFGDIEREVRILGKFEVTFIIDPFCYYRNVAVIDAKNITSITNPGTYFSRPYIKLTCSGTVSNAQLIVNSIVMKISTMTDFIEIDCLSRCCYKGATSVNLGKNVTADDYPILNTGVNTISSSTNITHVYITPRWRCF